MNRAKFARLQSDLNLMPAGMASAVLRFMVSFEQWPTEPGDRISPEDFELARQLMSEEVTEMWTGFDKLREHQSLENMTEFVDGAIDSIYVILWSLLKFHVPVDDCFSEVQRSNMAKLHDGKVVKYPEGHEKAGKVMKPDGWTPPDLFTLLMKHGEGTKPDIDKLETEIELLRKDAERKPMTDEDILRIYGLSKSTTDFARNIELFIAGGAGMTTITIDRAAVEEWLEGFVNCDAGKDFVGYAIKAATMLRSALAAQAAAPDLSDAYIGAREDLAIWKKRALEAEETARQLAHALAEEVNGPTFMGEPVLPATAPEQPASKALQDVANERRRQDAKYGGPTNDDSYLPSDWARLLHDRTSSFFQLSAHGYKQKAIRRLVQVAALAVAAAESMQRKLEKKP